MYVDLLDSNNYLMVNVSLINVLGLSGAAYCSELFTIMKKAIKKKKLVNNFYVEVDRDYISSRIGVSVNEQLALEKKWQAMDLIDKSEEADNVFNINVERFLTLAAGQESFNKTEIDKLKAKLKPKTTAQEREGKRNGIAKAVKNNLVCPTPEIKDKMVEWIDVMHDANKPLSNNIVKVFLDNIIAYAGGDTSVILKVIQKAITNAYADSAYAINAYETSLKCKRVNPSAEYRRATGEDLTGGHKF